MLVLKIFVSELIVSVETKKLVVMNYSKQPAIFIDMPFYTASDKLVKVKSLIFT